MITKLSHTSLFVSDQDKAYDFYVNKLGFNVHTDATIDNGFRWLTVTAPEAPVFNSNQNLKNSFMASNV